MTKTKATVSLCVLLVVVLFFSVFTFLPEVRMGNYTYNSPINLMIKGPDLGKSIAVNFDYEFDEDDTAEEIKADKSKIMSVMETRLESYGITDAQIAVSNTGLTLILPLDSYNDTFYKAVSQKGAFEINTKKDSLFTIVTDSRHFTKVYATYASGYYYVVMELDTEAKAALSQLTEKAAEEEVTIYFTLDGTEYTSKTLTEQLTENSIYLSMSSADEAQYLLTVLNSERYPLTMEKTKSWYLTASAGTEALTWAYVALGVITLAVFIALWATYGLSGLAAGISLLAVITLTVLASAFAFTAELSIAWVFGLLAAVAFYALFVSLILDKFRAAAMGDVEPNLTKRLRVSLTKSFDVYTKPLILTALVALVGSIAVWATATYSIKSFGIVLTYGIILGVLAILFLFKLLAKSFFVLSSSAKCHRVNEEVNQ